jgi:Kef-type K+ transport system membrane component KefB
MATSVGITARVLRDLGAVRLPPFRVILGAAVVDDILALLVLAVVAGLAGGPFSGLGLVVLLVEVVVFLGVVVAFGPRVVRWLSRPAHTPLIPRSPLVFAVLLTLGLAALSGTIGLASLTGAFLAGMIFEFSRKEVATQIERVYELLVPFLRHHRYPVGPHGRRGIAAAGPGAVITVIAVATKVAGGYPRSGGTGPIEPVGGRGGDGPSGRGRPRRGLGRTRAGRQVISRDLFRVVVAMSVVTTLTTPPVPGPIVRRAKRLREAGGHRVAKGTARSQGDEI